MTFAGARPHKYCKLNRVTVCQGRTTITSSSGLGALLEKLRNLCCLWCLRGSRETGERGGCITQDVLTCHFRFRSGTIAAQKDPASTSRGFVAEHALV